jgi:biotin carboxyl carrier protein
MKSVTIKINGHDEKVFADAIDHKIWFKINDRTFSFDSIALSQSSHIKSKSQSKSADKITAPMPGKMTKIFVSEGQSIKKGDPLIVMEAMKMEYTLKSDINGTVEKIFVEVLQQVTLGHLLVQLKAEVKK